MMAADSMASVDSSGFIYTTNKIYRLGETIVGISGSPSGAYRFLKWYEDGQNTDELPEFDSEEEYFVALLLNRNGIFRYECCCFPISILDDYAASGQGASIALAAMKLGQSPPQAVHLACELNAATGPPVVVEKL